MSHRVEQLNEQLQKEIAEIINREIPFDQGLITISYVDCSPDLKNARIGVSVLPDKLAGTALKKLNQLSSLISKELKKKLNIKFIPKFRWEFDSTEKNASVIDQIFKQIEEERMNMDE